MFGFSFIITWIILEVYSSFVSQKSGLLEIQVFLMETR